MLSSQNIQDKKTWASVKKKQWMDWGWQIRNRVTHEEDLEQYLNLTPPEREGICLAQKNFDWGVNPYYLSLANAEDPECPIRMQCIPRSEEHVGTCHELIDPLGEDTKMPVPGLIHRYPDRVLLLTTDRCSVYCRYCTRKRLVGSQERQLSKSDLKEVFDYIRSHTRIREVILSGGDPLISGDHFIDSILGDLKKIDHVETLRIHTRMPVVCPMRITQSLVDVLRKHHPLFLVTHFNHPFELTPVAREHLARLVDAGIPVANQSVLLRGVNSDPVIIEALCRELLKSRVIPYYLHQGDLATGTEHFRTPTSLGVEILEHLRGRLSGLGIPTFIVDLPGGKGKVALSPNYVNQTDDRGTITFRAPLGGTAEYPEPLARNWACATTQEVAKRYGIEP